MRYRLIILAVFSFFLLGNISNATSSTTSRTPQFSNDKVSVWETVIYPNANQVLKMHRHEHDRVIVAFSDGLLKITNDKGRVHYLKLKKNKAYYLTKDVPNELHKDQNMSSHFIKLLVVELKN
jgi:beta-alanine degradation protein BauB